MASLLTKESSPFRNHRALVVDDEETSRVVTRQILVGLGFGVADVARDGHQALSMLLDAPRAYHLVVADQRMPKITGLELLATIRRGAVGVARDVYFAMLTGFSDRAIVGAAFALDVDCFIVKPVSAEQMQTRLSRVMVSDRAIKPPAEYAKLSVRAGATPPASAVPEPEAPPPTSPGVVLTPRARRPKPGVAKGPGDSVVRGVPGRSVSLADARPGMVLSEDLYTTNGQLLLTRGYVMGERMIERLKELSELDITIRELMIERAD